MSPKPLKKRIRRTKDESRDLILSQAVELFSKRGFSETSFQAIADACGISHSAVLHHFGSKEKLGFEAAGFVLARNRVYVDSALSDEQGARERLENHFRRNLAWAREQPAMARTLVHFYYQASVSEGASETYALLLETARGRVQSHLMAAEREGLIAPGQDLKLLAEILYDALVGAFVNFMAIRSKKAPLAEFERKWSLTLARLAGLRLREDDGRNNPRSRS